MNGACRCKNGCLNKGEEVAVIVDDLGGKDSRLPFFCCRLELVDVVGCHGRLFVRRSTKNNTAYSAHLCLAWYRHHRMGASEGQTRPLCHWETDAR